MDVYLSIKYIDRILRVTTLKKYQQVLAECKEPENGLAGDPWSLGSVKGVYMEHFWTWSKVDAIDGSGDPISRSE